MAKHASSREAGEVGQAEILYRRSANAQHAGDGGNLDSAYRLAKLAARRGDDDSARNWLARAQERGDFLADFLLRSRFADFAGSPKKEALLRDLAEAGDVDCAYVLAKSGRHGAQRLWFRRAAEAGDPDAGYELGLQLQLGPGGAPADGDDSVGTRAGPGEWWWRSAAQRGHPGAAYLLSLVLEARGEKDESRIWLDAAAVAGYQQAIRYRGELRRRGARTSRDMGGGGDTIAPFAQAATMLWGGEYAAAQRIWAELGAAGDMDARFNLAVLAQHQGDSGEALRQFAVAAHASDFEACYRYGALLAQAGQVTEARTWLDKAADAGIEDAACALGTLDCESGSKESALRWWQSAALRGHQESAYRLALLFESEGDLIESKRLYRSAADCGHAGARDRYGDLILRTKADDIEFIWEIVRRRSAPYRPDKTRSLFGKGYRLIHTHEPKTSGDPVTAATAQPTKAPAAPKRSLDELLEGWAALIRLAPKPSRADPRKHVRFLAQQANLPEEVVDHVRRVRNQCAHPDRDGWPSPGDMDTALAALREIRRRLPPQSPQRAQGGA